MEMPMQHQIMGYDRAASMFSPDGRLLQVEYAEKMVKRGFASIGMICSDGVLLMANKRSFDRLALPETVKIFEVDKHVAVTGAGMLSDARVLITRAQVAAQQHRVTYDAAIDVESVVKEMSDIKQLTTQLGGYRPFGVALIVVGINPNKENKLYVTDVAGNYFALKASAIGENEEKIKEELEKKYKDDASVADNIGLCVNIFRKVLGKGFDFRRLECAYVTAEDRKFVRVAGEELKKYAK